MLEYISNIRDAYKHPVQDFNGTKEAFSSEKTSFNESQSLADYFQRQDSKDFYVLISSFFKLSALVPLSMSAYSVGKIAFEKKFTYTRLFLTATAFISGHDLARGGDNISLAFCKDQESEEVKQEKTKRGLDGEPPEPVWAEKVFIAVITRCVGFKVSQEKMDEKPEQTQISIREGIESNVQLTMAGTITKEISVFAQKLFTRSN
ncbi:MAG: hypothetical protein KDK76_01995 [Chlamydiia bacterium]|nr:hypothetical protein [Chlamydiia bacterium]